MFELFKKIWGISDNVVMENDNLILKFCNGKRKDDCEEGEEVMKWVILSYDNVI